MRRYSRRPSFHPGAVLDIYEFSARFKKTIQCMVGLIVSGNYILWGRLQSRDQNGKNVQHALTLLDSCDVETAGICIRLLAVQDFESHGRSARALWTGMYPVNEAKEFHSKTPVHDYAVTGMNELLDSRRIKFSS